MRHLLGLLHLLLLLGIGPRHQRNWLRLRLLLRRLISRPLLLQTRFIKPVITSVELLDESDEELGGLLDLSDKGIRTS